MVNEHLHEFAATIPIENCIFHPWSNEMLSMIL